MNLISTNKPLTMSSQEIAELLNCRHDNVKRTIERLAERNVIQLPPLEEVKNNKGQTVSCYMVNKRDSYVVVAQLSPEFTARLVDRWQELENLQKPKLPQTYLEALKELVVKEEENQRLVLELTEAHLEIDHKQEVIVELVDSLDLVQKRQILNKVMRRGSDYQERWNSLYSHFNNVYHCNVFLMADRKKCSKLDYVDKHLGKLDKLYEIAVKLFETDVKAVRLQLFPETV
jgi:phage regulator Rha-like protein